MSASNADGRWMSFQAAGKLVDRNVDGAKRERVYTVEGKESLSDGWGPTNANSRFFQVKVRLPE